MRIVTWNVNSVCARLERVLALLQRHRPDLVCLQETKSVDEGFPRRAMEELGYQVHAYGQKTYNGVALLSRQPLREERRGFDGDPVPHEARVISAQLTAGELDVINLYVVNGQTLGSEKYALKLRWLDALVDWISRTQDPARPRLVVGDFNIAPADIDVHAPELWHDRLLVSAPERARLQRLLDWGLVDLQSSRWLHSLQHPPRRPSMPSLTSQGTISSAASGSAHHQPRAALAARPSSRVSER